jgi:uncharacterized protein YoxC
MINLLFFISVLINVVFVWYIVQLLKRLLILSETMDEFFSRLKEYTSHVDVISNLESFYGDEMLANLLKHSKDILEETGSIRELYDPDYEAAIEEDYEEDAEEG